MRPFLQISNGRFFPRLRRDIWLLLCLVIPLTVKAADDGESIPLPSPYFTYVVTPGKLTGREFTLEKTLWREFRFDYDLPYNKPKETVALRFSLRGGYNPHDLFGHDEFEPKEAKDVATGWVPLGSGSFLIFPDQSKEHLPKWIPERTRLIRVPLIKQYDDTVVNAYDLALGLDRVGKGEAETIGFKLIPTTAENGKEGKRLVPATPLTPGVYYAYSLPDDTVKYHGVVHGFLFAVGNPALGTVNGQSKAGTSRGYATLDAEMASKVMDYALLSNAVYKDDAVPNWEKVDQGNCPIDLGLLDCLLESAKTGVERKWYGFNAQAYQNKNKEDKRLVIAFRGTDGLMDWVADYENAYLKGKPKQYEEALDFAERLIERFVKAGLGYKIILTGHSLGGGLASYAAIKLSRPSVSAVVFNAAGLGEGLTAEIELLSAMRISEIERKMNEGLSTEFQYLSDTLNKLNSEAKLGINITSVTNIHLVGNPVALFPGKQAGIFVLLTVPPHFVWYDDAGKQIEEFSIIGSHAVQLAYNPLLPRVVPVGEIVGLVGHAKNTQLLFTEYTKLLADHQGVDVRSLPIEPHYMTNVINAIKAKAANN